MQRDAAAVAAKSARGHSGPFYTLLALLLLAASPAAAEPVALVMAGDPAPDGNGVFQRFDGTIAVNAQGQVAFVAQLTGTQNPPGDTRGIFLADADSVIQLVRSGDPAPDGNGVFSDNFSLPREPFQQGGGGVAEQLALNDAGAVAFNAQLKDTSDWPHDAYGMFTASPLGGVTQILRIGDAGPDGTGTFGSVEDDFYFSAPGLDASGGLSFVSELGTLSGGLFGGLDDVGIFASDGGAPVRLLRVGAVAPGDDDPIVSIFPPFSSNAAGDVAINADVGPFFMDPPLPGDPLPLDSNRIYLDDGSTLTEVFRSGVPSPDGNGTVIQVRGSFLAGPSSSTLVLADDGAVVFQGELLDYTKIDFWADIGTRLLATDGAALTMIARTGDLGPGETEFRFIGFNAVDANTQDDLVFSARLLYRPSQAFSERTTGIYRSKGGVLQRLVRQGEPTPDGNGVFGEIDVPVFLNARGDVVFAAGLDGTANPTEDTSGIFLVDATGNLHQVARHGMPFAGSSVSSAGFLSNIFLPQARFAQAGTKVINDAGQVALSAVLADGRWGVFLVPEPGSAALSLTALAALTVLGARRRPRFPNALQAEIP